MKNYSPLTKRDLTGADRMAIVAYQHKFVNEYQTLPELWLKQVKVQAAMDYANIYIMHKLAGLMRRNPNV